jgi:hypothetical protein
MAAEQERPLGRARRNRRVTAGNAARTTGDGPLSAPNHPRVVARQAPGVRPARFPPAGEDHDATTRKAASGRPLCPRPASGRGRRSRTSRSHANSRSRKSPNRTSRQQASRRESEAPEPHRVTRRNERRSGHPARPRIRSAHTSPGRNRFRRVVPRSPYPGRRPRTASALCERGPPALCERGPPAPCVPVPWTQCEEVPPPALFARTRTVRDARPGFAAATPRARALERGAHPCATAHVPT